MFSKHNLNQYSVLIVSIALFVIFDLGVLGLNIYTSSKIKQQTERIDLAGRQRTLTQQLSKATLYIKSQQLRGLPYGSGLDELRNYYLLFDTTQTAFIEGGQTRSTDGNSLVEVEKVASKEGEKILAESAQLWQQFKYHLEPFFEDLLIDDEEILPASDFINENNNVLFTQMNDLTNHFSLASSRQISLLRQAQFVGITLATINFFIILFHFLRQLRERDDKIQQSQKEMQRIMSTVDQGLFLLDEQGHILPDYSDSMHDIFAEKNIAGNKLQYFLTKFVSRKDLEVTEGFLGLLFDPTKWGNLLDDLNPLKKIPVVVDAKGKKGKSKYLTFSFSRVIDENNEETQKRVKRVLATVTDVTEQVRLTKEIERLNSETDNQLKIFNLISRCNDFDELRDFLDRTKRAYNHINDLLSGKGVDSLSHTKRANNILSYIHTVKGDAASLSLDYIAHSCHDFEQNVKNLKKRDIIRGEDFLSLTIALKKLRSERSALDNLLQTIMTFQDDASIPVQEKQQKLPKQQFKNLSKLADEVAGRQGKKVELLMSGLTEADLSKKLLGEVNSILVQLVRNAIAHGIEKPKERSKQGKPEAGIISISLSQYSSGDYQLTVEDDGAGLSRKKIAKAAVDKKIITEKDADKLQGSDLVNLIFSPEFSTSSQADIDKGQGVGMFAVKDKVNDLGGKITIRSTVNKNFRVIIFIPKDTKG